MSSSTFAPSVKFTAPYDNHRPRTTERNTSHHSTYPPTPHTPPQRGTLLLKLDSTSVEGICKCPTFAYNYLVLHREAHAKDASLIFGGAIHEGIKLMLLGENPEAQNQIIVQYFAENPTPPDEYRTPTMALRVMSRSVAITRRWRTCNSKSSPTARPNS